MERSLPTHRRWQIAAALIATSALVTTPITGSTCTIPEYAHPTLQSAVDDQSCDLIQVAPGDYFESVTVNRSLVLDGPGSGAATLWGRLEANGVGVVAVIDGLEIYSGCPGAAMEALGGARIEGTDVQTIKSGSAACHETSQIFADGFESGDTSGWSAVVQ